MKTDEKVELARKIANQLLGVTSSEWNKWLASVKTEGLSTAMQMAQTLAKSQSLRPGPRRTYEALSRVMPKFRELDSVSSDDVLEILGYTTRWLISRRGTTLE